MRAEQHSIQKLRAKQQYLQAWKESHTPLSSSLKRSPSFFNLASLENNNSDSSTESNSNTAKPSYTAVAALRR